MIKPSFVTFTGVDDRTDLDRLREIAGKYPVEWGVLHSATRSGVDNRYPSAETLARIRTFAARNTLPVFAAHICGGYARKIVSGEDPDLDLSPYDRMQINYVPNPKYFPRAKVIEGGPQLGVAEILEFSFRVGAQPIVQHRTLTFPPTQPMLYLFDRSGGKGESPRTWPRHRQKGSGLVGFAGGLGPDNVLTELEKIDCHSPYWIDMEGNVRTDDWLDLDKCESVLRQIYGER